MRCVSTLIVCVLPALSSQPVNAQGAEDFYKGKTITIVTGTAAGVSVYDAANRALTRFLPRYMPGNPTVVVRYMPGASHAAATEYAYNVAVRDGLTIATVQPYVVLNRITNPAAKYEPSEFTWLARLAPITALGFVLTDSGVADVDGAKAKEIILGSAGATGPAAMTPWALNRMIGTKFRIVRGYTDDTAEFLALDRHEIQGIGSVSYASIAQKPGWLDQGRVKLLYSISLARLKQTPNVPALTELVNTERDRAVVGLLAAIPTIGLTVFAPPKIPADRAAALRRAMEQIATDPDFLADMKKSDVDIEPLRGDDLAAMVTKAMATPPDVVEALKSLTSPPD